MSEWSGRLSALGNYEPPPAGWRAVLAAQHARGSGRDRHGIIAVAAVVLVATACLAGGLLPSRQVPFGTDDGAGPAVLAVAAGMRAENDRLESVLARLPEPHVMRGSTAFTLAELEDRLALLDDRLSRVALEPNAPERSEQLWRERIGVMHSLVQVRYADAVGKF